MEWDVSFPPINPGVWERVDADDRWEAVKMAAKSMDLRKNYPHVNDTFFFSMASVRKVNKKKTKLGWWEK